MTIEARCAVGRGGAETLPRFGVVQKEFEARGDGARVVRLRQETVGVVADKLGDATDESGHDGNPARHRLDEHIRDAVAVTVVGDPRCQGENVCALVDGNQFPLGPLATELDDLSEPETVTKRLEVSAPGAFAVDLTSELATGGGE